MKSSISVIIPVYNTKEFLKPAIDSVLEQKQFIKEIIIINDGSTDGSGEYLEKYYGSNSVIKIIHTDNFGQGNARNIGIEKSSGNYIYCFDSDDILIKGIFEKFLSVLNDNPELEIFCFSGESFLDKNFSKNNVQNKNLLKDNAYKRNFNKSFSSGEEAYAFLIYNNSYYPGPPLYIFKKSILNDNNIKFQVIRYEDEEFTTNLFLHAGTVLTTKTVYFRRRIRSESTMQKQKDFNDIIGYLENIKSIEKLKKNSQLQKPTKILLDKRVINFVKKIITIKTAHNIKMSQNQKEVLNQTIKPIMKNNKELLIFKYEYPFRFKLNKIKSKFII